MLRKLRAKFVAIAVAIVGLVLIFVLGSSLYTSYSSQMAMTDQALARAIERGFDNGPRMGRQANDTMMLVISVDVTSTGVMLRANDIPTLIDPGELEGIVSYALQSEETDGYDRDVSLAWRKAELESGNGWRVAVADTSLRDETLRQQAANSATIFLGAMVPVALLAFFLSSIALRPVANAWEQQRRFIADASHELKTPLSVILANTQILMEDKDVPVDSRRWIASTSDEATHMKELINELLELARTEKTATGASSAELSIEDLDLSAICDAAALGFDALAYERGCTIEEQIAADVHVRGDKVLIERAVRSLIDNATKYADEGTAVKVALSEDGGHAVYAVSNRGGEIAPEDIPHIFDRFYRTDKARAREESGGFGLGLAIVKSIVDAHNGTIGCTSENGVTTFTITL